MTSKLVTLDDTFPHFFFPPKTHIACVDLSKAIRSSIYYMNMILCSLHHT